MSMRDAGILEGDLLAVHRTRSAHRPDRGGAPRRRGHGQALPPARHAVQLEAENPEFAPIEVDLRRDALTIEGIAVGVIRNGKGL